VLVSEERREVQRAFLRDRESHDVAFCLHIQIDPAGRANA
jgi:hypothetical protein